MQFPYIESVTRGDSTWSEPINNVFKGCTLRPPDPRISVVPLLLSHLLWPFLTFLVGRSKTEIKLMSDFLLFAFDDIMKEISSGVAMVGVTSMTPLATGDA